MKTPERATEGGSDKESSEKRQNENLEPIRLTIAILKCEEKVALQYIKCALEEAQTDLQEIGRPLTFIVHDGAYDSLLSAGVEEEPKDGGRGRKENKGPVQLRGIVNLLYGAHPACPRRQPR